MYIQIKLFPVLENYMLPAGSFLWELVLLPIDTRNHFPHPQRHPTSKYCNEECLHCFLPSKRHFLDPSESINSLTFHIDIARRNAICGKRAVNAALCSILCPVTSHHLSPHPVASNTSHQTTQRYLQRTYLIKDLYPEFTKNIYNLIVRRQAKNEQKLEETFIQRYTNV